jgi:hypothetical protein
MQEEYLAENGESRNNVQNKAPNGDVNGSGVHMEESSSIRASGIDDPLVIDGQDDADITKSENSIVAEEDKLSADPPEVSKINLVEFS